jgi:hypothetical protein
VRKLITILLLGVVLMGIRTARADDNSAVVVATDYCLVFDASCSNSAIYVPVRQFSVTNSAGNSTITCKADLPAGATLPPKGAVKCNFANTGDLCPGANADGTPNFSDLSSDWTEVVTPSGQASLVCHFKR